MTIIRSEQSQQAAAEYVQSVFEKVIARNPHENEFHQAVKEILDSLVPVLVPSIPSICSRGFWNGLWSRNGSLPSVCLG